jgi:hypothetical protein
MNSRKYFSVTNTKLLCIKKEDILAVFDGWDSFVRENCLLLNFISL